jgi:hypothetical protein
MGTHHAIMLPLLVALAVTAGCGREELPGPAPSERSPTAPPGATQPPGSAVKPPAGTPLSLVRFESGPGPLNEYSGWTEEANSVIRTPSEWTAAWERIWAQAQPRPARPVVDFDVAMVVVAALGPRGSGGHAIYVDSAYQRDGHIEVVIRKVSPGAGCASGAVMTSPVDAARIPRSLGEVKFTEKKVIIDCG